MAKGEKGRAREGEREKRAAEKMKVRKGNEVQKTNNPTGLMMADVGEGCDADTTVMGRGDSNNHPEKPVSVQ